jgi:hypothetical protein
MGGFAKMGDPAWNTDDEWRRALAAQIIKLELAVYEVGFAVILIAFGVFVGAHWWSYGLIAGAVIFLVLSYRNELKDFRRLRNWR